MGIMTLPECRGFLAANTHAFYVYILHRPCGAPFYVGKGTGDRISEHTRPSKIVAHQIRARVMAKIVENGKQVGYSIVGLFDSEAEAFAEERRLIALHGRIDIGNGILSNQTDGGEGGCNPSAETIARRVVGLKAAMDDPEYKAKAVACLHSDASREKAIAGIRQALRSDGFRAAKSNEMLEKWKDDDFREKVSSASRAAQDGNWKLRHAAGIARVQADPEFHKKRNAGLAKVRARINASCNKPECIERRRNSGIEQRARQEHLRQEANMLAGLLCIERSLLPDHRASVSVWMEVVADLKLFELPRSAM